MKKIGWRNMNNGGMYLRSQLYLWEPYRESLKNEIRFFTKIYFDKIRPAFSNIDAEAEEYKEKLLANFNRNYDSDYPDFNDYISIIEQTHEITGEYWLNLDLMKHNSLLMWIAMLYQYWEQQMRRFLHNEMKKYFKIEFAKFCVRIEEIKKCFSFHGIDIESLQSWDKVNELRLLCNVIKHGDGSAAKKLYKIRPDLFKSEDTDMLRLYKTTLLDHVIQVTEEDLQSYSDALIELWDQFPERMYEIEQAD